jgi:hypothetical protein
MGSYQQGPSQAQRAEHSVPPQCEPQAHEENTDVYAGLEIYEEYQ